MMNQDRKNIKGFAVAETGTRGGMYVGNWRVETPSVDKEKCTGCRLCLMYCPEGAIRADEAGKPEIDMRFCKGCGVCANECPTKGMIMKKEAD
jgi:pyruvate ferredoxin oxidoreductase delta subunit